jgi:CO/xanthine dehydrogenase FAD-binding subunit
MQAFNYSEPTNVEYVLELLNNYKIDAKVLAGGTDILVQMKQDKVKPKFLISLARLESLKGIKRTTDGWLTIGALTSASELQKSELLKDFPLLADAAKAMACPEIRHKATIGGNIVNASPAGDLCTALLALDAIVTVQSIRGSREIKIDDFFKGPGLTALNPDELLTTIRIPPLPKGVWGVYKKVGVRRAMEIGIVCTGVVAGLNYERERMIRIALGSAAPTPIRAKKAESYLLSVNLTRESILEAGKISAEESKPITDVRASDWYRKIMIKYTVSEALKELKLI